MGRLRLSRGEERPPVADGFFAASRSPSVTCGFSVILSAPGSDAPRDCGGRLGLGVLGGGLQGFHVRYSANRLKTDCRDRG